MSDQLTEGYAGDLSAEVAYAMLERDKSAVLVDVRTRAEWSYVGAPDLSGIDKEAVFLEWQEFPSMTAAPNFVPDLLGILRERGVSADAPLLFLCRSGARSRAAATALTGAGRERCYNISEGFEGRPDPGRKRGRIDGWKARGLPWAQS